MRKRKKRSGRKTMNYIFQFIASAILLFGIVLLVRNFISKYL
jgi:hypothetical protein